MKSLFFTFLLSISALIIFAQGEPIRKIGNNYAENLTKEDVKKCKCNNINYIQLKPNAVRLALLSFATRGDAYYVHYSKVFTYGNYITYNKSGRKKDDGGENSSMVLLNRDVLKRNNWRIPPYTKLTVLTTAEDIEDAYFLSGTWKLKTPTEINGKTYNYGNYASNGQHPAVKTQYPSYDAEIRFVLLVDKDDNISTRTDNELFIDCIRLNIDF